MFTLRDFLYLDERTVKRYLSSIEKGLVKEVMKTDVNTKPNWEFEVSLGKLQQLLMTANIPVPDVGVKRTGKDEKVAVQITKEPTIDSQFDQLISYLQPVLQHLEEFNSKTWAQLKEGQFIYYPSRVTLPKGYQNTQMLNVVADFYELATSMEDKSMIEGSDELEKVIEQSKGYREAAASKTFTNINSIPINTPNERKYYFVAKMIHDNLVDCSLEDLSLGTAYTLARVENILGGNDRYTVFDSTLKGVDKIMNRKERRKQNGDLFEVATKPAVVIRPIAIFKE